MIGLSLLMGHLLGDYVLQNDWMAINKTKKSWPCFVHCCCYTAAVFACCFWFLPWWGYVVVWLTHFPIDRLRLARVWMSYSGQESFATGPLSPWSIIVVDNVGHLLVLCALGMSVSGFQIGG